MKNTLLMAWLVLFASPVAQPKDLCRTFDAGKDWKTCLTNCRSATCDFIYRDGSSWCAAWCTGQDHSKGPTFENDIGC